MNSERSTNKITCIGCLGVLAIFLILAILLLPAVQYSREAARCIRCKNNMKQIGIALRNYHDHFGSFPPAYTIDAEGNPLHSWRTLILPYFAPGIIEPKWKDIYDKIRFDEPWDSEYNIQFNEYVEHTDEEWGQYHHYDGDKDHSSFHHNMPAVYGCQNFSSGDETVKTVYKMVVGENAVGNLQGASLSQIKRPPDKTVLMVEAGLPVPWMSPSDFAVEDFETALYPKEASEIRWAETRRDNEEFRAAGFYSTRESELAKRQILGGWHGRELHILFVDGSLKTYWDEKLPISEIELMSRIKE